MIKRLLLVLVTAVLGIGGVRGEEGHFVKVSSQEDIIDGGQYIIVREVDNHAYAAGVATQNYLPAHQISKGTYNGNVNTDNNPYIFTLKLTDDGYFRILHNNIYLCGASGDNSLSLKTSYENYAKWTINVNPNRTVKIESKSAKTSTANRQIRYSSEKFANYDPSNGFDITLYKRVEQIKISSAGWATFYTDQEFQMPQGVEGYVVIEQDGIQIVKTYQTGNIVPALTPLLVKGIEGTYNCVITNTSAQKIEENFLRGQLLAGPIKAENEGTWNYYKLALGSEGGNEGKIGFYWGAENGAPFDLTGNNRAYLILPKTEVKGLVFEDFIDEIVQIKERRQDNHIYNVSGLSINNPSKGLIIKDGRKFFSK